MEDLGNLALFGGSFNPPHLGHQEMIEYLCKDLKINTILICPSYNHPYKKSDLETYSHRLEMCRELVSKEITKKHKVRVTDIESEWGDSPSYTIEVVKNLKKRYLYDRFFLILGSDCKNDVHNWHHYDDLKQEVEFYFIPRAGIEDSEITNISSSEVRQLIREGLSWEKFVPDKIAQYIKRYQLYEEKT